MKPLFPWLQKRLEAQARSKLERPVRYAAIVFGILLILCAIGAWSGLTSSPPQRVTLDVVFWAALTVVAVSFWFTLIATGTLLVPFKIRRILTFSLLPLQSACLVVVAVFLALLVLSHIDPSWIFVVLDSARYIAEAILLSWTVLSLWGWIRYLRGFATD
jgi:hypothetical protein